MQLVQNAWTVNGEPVFTSQMKFCRPNQDDRLMGSTEREWTGSGGSWPEPTRSRKSQSVFLHPRSGSEVGMGVGRYG